MSRSELIKDVADRIYGCYHELIFCKEDLDNIGRLGKYVKRLDSTLGKLDNLIRELDARSK